MNEEIEIIESCGNVFEDIGCKNPEHLKEVADLLIKGHSPLPNGCTLYWHTNEMGNRVYSSDEIGGGVHVWDVTLIDPNTLLAALTKEAELGTLERETFRKSKMSAEQLLERPDTLAVNILRNWERDRVIRFAKHLLGSEYVEE